MMAISQSSVIFVPLGANVSSPAGSDRTQKAMPRLFTQPAERSTARHLSRMPPIADLTLFLAFVARRNGSLQNNPGMGSASQIIDAWPGNASVKVLKGLEPPIGVDVVDDNRSARPQSRPGAIQLEANILFAVQAVMNKKVNLAQFGK
jgi:hypothetical protein